MNTRKSKNMAQVFLNLVHLFNKEPTTTALQKFLDATGLQENKFFEMLVDRKRI